MTYSREANARLAHALARIGLGINIALHGLTRLPDLDGFARGMQEQLAKGFLPSSLVYATGLAIPIAEALLGLLVLIGWRLREALIAGTVLMIVLITGACSAQNWSAAGIQMTYLAFYVALIATLHHDALSIDAWRRRTR